jgi:flagellar basal body-associated protein FliL
VVAFISTTHTQPENIKRERRRSSSRIIIIIIIIIIATCSTLFGLFEASPWVS